jgi:isoamylase
LLSSVVHWLLAAIVWLVQVILDVVFNHTAEGNEKGPTLSFRGLDNRVYYMLAPLGEYYNYR